MAEDIDDFPEAFTNYIATWNLLEMAAQTLLVELLGRSGAALAVAVEMKNTALTNALLAAARSDNRPAKATLAIEHFVEGFIRLREHRNLSVHGLVAAIDRKGDAPAYGFRMVTHAKGRLKYADMPITTVDLKELTTYHFAFQEFADDILHALRAEKRWPLPNTLPLPKRLEKTLHNLEPHFPPLRS